MNKDLKDINEIINLCEQMLDYIAKYGIIRSGNNLYNAYKEKVSRFFEVRHLEDKEFAPYAVLSRFYFTSSYSPYTVNKSEATMIYKTIVDLKHELYGDKFERVFISHREKDESQVTPLINLLHAIGIPRPINEEKSIIFSSSHPASYIDNGCPNLDYIKKQFTAHAHTFYIMWYSDNYFESKACLNECGAVWVMDKKYQEILAPNFDEKKIDGLLLDSQPVWFRATDKQRLNTFKSQIEKMFDLPSLSQNAWEKERDAFIKTIQSINF